MVDTTGFGIAIASLNPCGFNIPKILNLGSKGYHLSAINLSRLIETLRASNYISIISNSLSSR